MFFHHHHTRKLLRFFTHKTKKAVLNGQGLVEYAIILGLVALVTIGGLVLAGGGTKNAYEKVVGLFSGAVPTPIPDDLYPSDRITIKVTDEAGEGISNVVVYAYQNTGSYLGKYGRTNEAGLIEFLDMPDGAYKFRADLQGQQFWSSLVSYPETYFAMIQTTQKEFSVKVVDAAGQGISNALVYGYTSSGSYVSVSGKTGSDGTIKLGVVDGNFKFRAVYQAHSYWSLLLTLPTITETIINTGQDDFAVKVVDQAGNGISTVVVYAYNTAGDYAGVYGRTAADGIIHFQIADGDFKFKAYHQGHDFWSSTVVLPGIRSTTIQTQQQPFWVSVVDAAGKGIANVVVYAYNSAGQYAGTYGRTDSSGVLALDLAVGSFKLKAYYQNHEFWSGLVNIPESSSTTINTGQKNITLTVLNGDQVPINKASAYVYSSAGNYANLWGQTNADGKIVLGLANGSFRIRVNTGNQDYWSEIVTMPGSTDILVIAK